MNYVFQNFSSWLADIWVDFILIQWEESWGPIGRPASAANRSSRTLMFVPIQFYLQKPNIPLRYIQGTWPFFY